VTVPKDHAVVRSCVYHVVSCVERSYYICKPADSIETGLCMVVCVCATST